MKTNEAKITSGTKEWADYNINFCFGCSHNCRYCYAKKIAIHYNRKTGENWKEMVINEKAVNTKYRKRHGRGMLPTSHDITPEILNETLIILNSLLKAGNIILITTKPHLDCIKEICTRFTRYKSQIQFRFTIGSDKNTILKFWEPGAPNFEERLESLKFAFEKGYMTSISIEPYLSDPTTFIKKLNGYVTESIWIGPMNYIKNTRIPWNKMSHYDRVRVLYKRQIMLPIYNCLKNHPKVKFKDSFYTKSRINHKQKTLEE